MGAKLVRLASLSHKMDINISDDKMHGRMTLNDSERMRTGEAFTLYVRDEKINEPVAVTALNAQNQQAILVSILPDLRAPLIRK